MKLWKFAIALIGSGVVVGLGYWYGMPKEFVCRPPKPHNKVLSSDLVLQSGHSLKPDKDNGAKYIHGTVKNVSKYRYLAVKVNFDLKDKANSVIPGARVSAYVQAIEPGKEWEFKVLLLDPDAIGYGPVLPVLGTR